MEQHHEVEPERYKVGEVTFVKGVPKFVSHVGGSPSRPRLAMSPCLGWTTWDTRGIHVIHPQPRGCFALFNASLFSAALPCIG